MSTVYLVVPCYNEEGGTARDGQPPDREDEDPHRRGARG